MASVSTVTDWLSVEKWAVANDDIVAAAKQFGLKEDTVRKRAARHKWPLPSVIARRAAEIKIATRSIKESGNGALIEQTAKTLAERGEKHAEMVFGKATAALESMKKFPVRNARDVELIDRVARRAAGLENDEQHVNVSLIALNERIDSHEVIEAEVIEDNPATRLPESLDAGQLETGNQGSQLEQHQANEGDDCKVD